MEQVAETTKRPKWYRSKLRPLAEAAASRMVMGFDLDDEPHGRTRDEFMRRWLTRKLLRLGLEAETEYWSATNEIEFQTGKCQEDFGEVENQLVLDELDRHELGH